MRDGIEAVAVATLVALLGACTSRAKVGQHRRSSDEPKRGAATFVCAGDRCVQRHPRLPDDGEWTCSDMAGAAVCSGGDPPAGVPFNVTDHAWVCGARRTPERGAELASHGDRERVCVDLAPDFPDGTARGWRCRYDSGEGVTRICDRDPAAHVIGDPCGRQSPCLDGLRCVAGHCTPDAPAPSCVADSDCGEEVCRLGSCWRGPT